MKGGHIVQCGFDTTERKRVRGQNSTRIVPMSPLLRKALEEWFRSEPNGKFTFGITASISRCRAKADGPTPLTVEQAHDHLQRALTGKWSRVRGWHVLRHSFASNCAAKAVDQRTINAWMGHQTEEMVRRYRHLIPDLQQRAIQSVFGHTPSAA